uniref:Uncharacterized protein n=1 Tax=Arundo donax TaxID=35708 RepID=A0A0A9ELK2_ARUDO
MDPYYGTPEGLNKFTILSILRQGHCR